MINLTITPIYASLIALILAALSIHAGASRVKHNIALGDGANNAMALSIRRFGNLAEYAAMAILLLLLMELKGLAPFWLHTYGIILVILRVIHPIILFDEMSAPLWKKIGRFISAVGTAMLYVIASIALLTGSVQSI